MRTCEASLLVRASGAAALILAAIAAPSAHAQVFPPMPPFETPGWMNFLHAVDCTRIADPKLDGGGVDVRYQLDPARTPYHVTITVLSNGAPVVKVFESNERGTKSPNTHHWDGRDAAGKYCDPGDYTVRVVARTLRATRQIEYAVDLVRLGIKNISADSTGTSGANEWQTVYFMKNGKYAFYATPATGEFVSRAGTGEIADLDLNDGSPRPAPAVWTKTDEPKLEPAVGGGWRYDTNDYNYPLCYLAGATPQFTVRFGSNCVLANGTVGTCHYPVTGYDIRCVASDEAGDWTTSTTNIQPGNTETLTGPPLTALETRTERQVSWKFEYRPTGGSTWSEVPGTYTTTHRFYTILDTPVWATGASGTQYSGPWIETLEDLYTWAGALSVTCDNSDHVVEAFIKGYFGQNGTITTAIEGVEYDCPANGGDGGATHYGWDSFNNTVQLSHLLNAHGNGIYVNCTDCATTTSTMLSMLGVHGFQLDQLGSMTLRAIWGIGCVDYTLDIWNNGGGSGHGFSYHHIITRDAATHISDACLWVDEDGNPDALPGTPGYNNDRLWTSYSALLAHATPTQTLQPLPKIK